MILDSDMKIVYYSTSPLSEIHEITQRPTFNIPAMAMAPLNW